LAEINALFVADLEENWISEDLVASLGLTRCSPEKKGEYGRLERRTVRFSGTVLLQWTELGNRTSKFTPCRVVLRESFGLYLQQSLLSPQTPPAEPVKGFDPIPLRGPAPEVSSPSENTCSSAPTVGSFDGSPEDLDDNSKEYDL
jgi:hypothetical protein